MIGATETAIRVENLERVAARVREYVPSCRVNILVDRFDRGFFALRAEIDPRLVLLAVAVLDGTWTVGTESEACTFVMEQEIVERVSDDDLVDLLGRALGEERPQGKCRRDRTLACSPPRRE